MSLDAARIQLPGRYRVVRHVANGGMASVWSAEDSILGRLVAVKVLAGHVAADVSARARFEREARTAAKVSDHPNVVTIYDVGEHEGTPFIVMELLTGGTVADRLRASGSGRPVARSTAAQWLEQAASALDHAHAEGIVHRDVKPANLLLDERDRLAVGDFGIARAADDVGLTQAGQVLGTAAYLSPEQALGKQATAASDRYALAVVAYELLTGRRPFQGETVPAQARQHVEDEVPSTGLGEEVDAVLRRAMAKEPDDRYFTASRFVEELGAVARRVGAPLEAPTDVTRAVPRSPTTSQPTATPPRRLTPTPPAGVPAGAAGGRGRGASDLPPPPPPRDQQGRGGGNGRKVLLTLLAALAGAAAAFAVFSLVGGDDDPSSTPQRAQTQERQQEEPAATQEEQPQATTPPATEEAPPAAAEETPQEQGGAVEDNEPEEGPGPDSESAESPSQLDAQGYQLIQQGRAAEAVPLLEQAVRGFEAQGDGADPTGYGYALFNLGTAYAATGRPAEAIELFERRLQVSPDDRPEVVRKALKDARKAAGKS